MMKNKKKIIFFTGRMNIGGIQKSLINLLNNLDYNLFEVHLVIESPGQLLNEIPENVKLLPTPIFYRWLYIPKNGIKDSIITIGLNKNLFKYLFYLIQGLLSKNMGISRQKLFESVKSDINNFDGEYDIAIDFNGKYRNIISEKINSNRKITWIHSDYEQYKLDIKLDYTYLKQMDDIIAVSETAKKMFISCFPDLEPKTKVIHNIIDNRYILEKSKEYYPREFKNNTFKIVNVTRLDPNKGLDTSINVAEILLKKGINFQWIVVGNGPEYNNLNKLIERKNLNDNFLLVGEKENPYPYIYNSDIFVHCSKFEGKSIAIDEAKILLKPIIVTNYPTVKDQVIHEKDGYITSFNPKEIADSILRIFKDKELEREIVLNLKNKPDEKVFILNQIQNLFNK